MPEWSVDNWDILALVSSMYIIVNTHPMLFDMI